MNAEFTITTDLTVEFEVSGIVVTIFNGEDSDGTVVQLTYAALTDDIFELATYDANGLVLAEDKEYGISVANSLIAAGESLRNRLNAA